MKRRFCDTFWGSHGCDLDPGHLGDCVCLLIVSSIDTEEPWVWIDQGDWCNFWDGKQLCFLYLVCSYRHDWNKVASKETMS